MLRRLWETYRRAYSGLPRTVWLLAIAQLVNRSGTMVLPFMALYLTEERGIGPDEAGAFLGAYGLGAIAGSYAGGWLSDRIDVVRIQVASLTLSALLFFSLAHLESPAAIAPTLFALAVVSEAFRPAGMVLLAMLCPEQERTKGYALLRLAVNVGMTIGPAAGGFLARHDFSWLFFVDAATCLAAAVLMLRYFGGGRRPAETETEGAAGDGETAAGSPWRDGGLMALMGFTLLVAVIFFQAESTMPLFLRDAYGLDPGRIGALFAVNTVLIVVLEMVLVEALRSRRQLDVIAAGALLTGAGFALMPLGGSMVWAAATIVVWTFGEMMTAPLLGAVVAARAAPANRGRYLAMLTLSFSTAHVVAPMSGTAIYAHLGSGALWASCGGLGVVACIGFLAVGRHR